MSDYNRNPDAFDKYGNPLPNNRSPGTVYEPVAEGRAPYVLLGLLVLIGIVGGAVYFNGTPTQRRDVATAPPAASTPVRTPAATPGAPADTTR